MERKIPALLVRAAYALQQVDELFVVVETAVLDGKDSCPL